eukprot:8782176-Karenia_brevis.AAC.1
MGDCRADPAGAQAVSNGPSSGPAGLDTATPAGMDQDASMCSGPGVERRGTRSIGQEASHEAAFGPVLTSACMMPRVCLLLDVISFNEAISTCEERGQWSRVAPLFDEMPRLC